MLAVLLAGAALGARAAEVPLTVCADPDDLPYSNRAQQGFENRIAALLAADLHHPLRYYWWPQMRGFGRKTLTAARCDLWLGVARDMAHIESTRPYYRSSYMFVTRRAETGLAGLTFDDPRLKNHLIGVQMVGSGAGSTPPAHALAVRGIVANVRGFMVDGEAAASHPRAAILDALIAHRIDVAIVWGPQAGFYARRSPMPLRLEPARPDDEPAAPMTYAIAMAVRRGETALERAIDASLEAHAARIRKILDDYGVPQLPLVTASSVRAPQPAGAAR